MNQIFFHPVDGTPQMLLLLLQRHLAMVGRYRLFELQCEDLENLAMRQPYVKKLFGGMGIPDHLKRASTVVAFYWSRGMGYSDFARMLTAIETETIIAKMNAAVHYNDIGAIGEIWQHRMDFELEVMALTDVKYCKNCMFFNGWHNAFCPHAHTRKEDIMFEGFKGAPIAISIN